MKVEEIQTRKPWLVHNGRGWLLCLMCPMDKADYYRGIRPERKTRAQVARWMRKHRCCGFRGD